MLSPCAGSGMSGTIIASEGSSKHGPGQDQGVWFRWPWARDLE